MWLGANDIEKEGTWVWNEKENGFNSSWLYGAPNNLNKKENCLVLEGHMYEDIIKYRKRENHSLKTEYSSAFLGWNDIDCSTETPYFIQYALDI